MSRLGKYMVFNPTHDKPVKFFARRDKAVSVAEAMRNKLGEDFLVIQVVGIARKEGNTKVLWKKSIHIFNKVINRVWRNYFNRLH